MCHVGLWCVRSWCVGLLCVGLWCVGVQFLGMWVKRSCNPPEQPPPNHVSWRTLWELYTRRKLEYHHTVPGAPYSCPICTERDFQARWKELVAPVQLDEPVAMVLPKATGISWPFASWVPYILSRPRLVRSINRNFPLTFIVRGDVYPVARGNGTQLTISLANFDGFARSPAGLWALSMANCDDKAMDTLGTLWKSNREVGLSPSAFHSF